ncbi:MAG: hypothetical protein KAV87_00440 [Desulfobacteraceae bacterium]|nr:hypothetical protein [Desulfobacteraceae bacterium]
MGSSVAVVVQPIVALIEMRALPLSVARRRGESLLQVVGAHKEKIEMWFVTLTVREESPGPFQREVMKHNAGK